jgi:hypothetical protein
MVVIATQDPRRAARSGAARNDSRVSLSRRPLGRVWQHREKATGPEPSKRCDVIDEDDCR